MSLRAPETKDLRTFVYMILMSNPYPKFTRLFLKLLYSGFLYCVYWNTLKNNEFKVLFFSSILFPRQSNSFGTVFYLMSDVTVAEILPF